MNRLGDVSVEGNRKVFENSPAGRRAVAGNPDRRLYAVAKPTRAENLKRIQNVFCEMDSGTLHSIFLKC